MESSAFTAAATFMFALEIYHFLSHICVLFRLRLLPQKDLVRVRYYFLFDTLTVATSTFIFTGKLRWLAVIQIIQHMFFFITWHTHPYTKKVIAWSSLDWQKSTNKQQWDVFFGTLFDVLVHAINAYLLYEYLGVKEALIAIGVVLVLSMAVLFNRKLAWSTPGYVPNWVDKRVKPVKNYT